MLLVLVPLNVSVCLFVVLARLALTIVFASSSSFFAVAFESLALVHSNVESF